jgi:hypothetical protein
VRDHDNYTPKICVLISCGATVTRSTTSKPD